MTHLDLVAQYLRAAARRSDAILIARGRSRYSRQDN